MVHTRLLLSGTVIILAFFLVLISAARIAQPSSLAFATNYEVNQASSSAAISGDEKIDYSLPYPGILPDHPLYWIKMVRDRIRLLLTRDPRSRYDLMILYADKRLGAGQALILGNQPKLGVSTITKAEKYLFQAVSEFAALNQNEGDQPERVNQLIKILLKHQEIIKPLIDRVPDEDKKALEEALHLNQLIFDTRIKTTQSAS